MPRLQRPGANSDLIKSSEDRDRTARHVQWRDGLIEQTMEIDELPENDERLLKKPEIKRDEMGRFEQAGTGLIRKSQVIKKPKHGHGGLRAGAGRPRGSKNKISLALKEMILQALDEAGGVDYLKRLAIENSSAFASLLGRVLPTTLQADESSGGLGTKITFERVIVMPDGQRWIEGKTPLQIAPPERRYDGGTERPASHTLPNSEEASSDVNKNSYLEDYTSCLTHRRSRDLSGC
jgi:hypothetical protein